MSVRAPAKRKSCNGYPWQLIVGWGSNGPKICAALCARVNHTNSEIVDPIRGVPIENESSDGS
eukprot:3007463-Prorocentrum_lima.AAC.1